MRDFDLQSLIDHIDRSLERLPGPAVAAFDADGTLWSSDMGTFLFDYQIRKGLLPNLPPHPYKHYHKMASVGGVKGQTQAYLWLAQINAGQRLSVVRKWAREALEALPSQPSLAFFPEQKIIIDHLHQKGVEVFVVTASVKWSVEPAAELYYNIDRDHVIGVSTEVVDGVITDKPSGPITYLGGKVVALLQHTRGVKPFFCSGNTEADLPLLESATDLRLAVSSVPKVHENYRTEQVMQKVARQNNWYALNIGGGTRPQPRSLHKPSPHSKPHPRSQHSPTEQPLPQPSLSVQPLPQIEDLISEDVMSEDLMSEDL